MSTEIFMTAGKYQVKHAGRGFSVYSIIDNEVAAYFKTAEQAKRYAGRLNGSN
jgi:hypothetical protein